MIYILMARIKIALVGTKSCGKTTFLYRLQGHKTQIKYTPTEVDSTLLYKTDTYEIEIVDCVGDTIPQFGIDGYVVWNNFYINTHKSCIRVVNNRYIPIHNIDDPIFNEYDTKLAISTLLQKIKNSWGR